jgi:hypothetical protein
MVITDESIRRVIGDYYRQAVESYLKSPRSAAALFADDPARNAVQRRVGGALPISASIWVTCPSSSSPASVRQT